MYLYIEYFTSDLIIPTIDRKYIAEKLACIFMLFVCCFFYFIRTNIFVCSVLDLNNKKKIIIILMVYGR